MTKKLLFIALALLLFSRPAYAAISVDTSSSAEYTGGSNQATLTWSHTVGAGSDTVLWVQSSAYSDSGAASAVASGVTYNGTAMTQAVAASSAWGNVAVSLWYLVAPATGAHDVVITYAASGSNYNGGGAVSFFGASQTGIPDSSNSGDTNASSGVISTTTSADNSWTISTFATQNVAVTGVGASQTFNFDRVFHFHGGSYKTAKTPAGAETHTYTNGGSTQNWTIAIASFAPSGSARRRSGQTVVGKG